MNICAVVLAGGKGTRMHTDIAKCVYPIKNKPMITYIIETLNKCNIDDICVVVGYKKEQIMDVLQSQVVYAYQSIQDGTASALQCASSYWKNKNGLIIILPGDIPFITKDIIEEAINEHIISCNDLTIISTILDNPTGYGRIIKDKNIYIKEEKDASIEELKIKEVNTGIYIINSDLLENSLSKISNQNYQHEYYLTDIVKVLSSSKLVGTYFEKDYQKLIGINDLYTLKKCEDII